MQGIFQKENTDKALKYGIYRHLPTYEKIIRNLVSFYLKNGYGDMVIMSLETFEKNSGMSDFYGNVKFKKGKYSDRTEEKEHPISE